MTTKFDFLNSFVAKLSRSLRCYDWITFGTRDASTTLSMTGEIHFLKQP